MCVQHCDGEWPVGMGCQAEAIAANTGAENLEGQHLFTISISLLSVIIWPIIDVYQVGKF
jgi:hypothetical protein